VARTRPAASCASNSRPISDSALPHACVCFSDVVVAVFKNASHTTVFRGIEAAPVAAK
jgi:hypothetical protein